MEFNQTCEFAPMFVVFEKYIWFPCDDDFIADELVKDDAGFDSLTVNGTDFYPMKWLVGRGWFTFDFLTSFTRWAETNGIEADDILPPMSMTWVTKDGDEPEFVRTIGFATDGDAYVALRSIDLPGCGLEAKTTVYLGEKFVSVQDWAKVDKEGFEETVLGKLLPMLAEKHDCKCNPFG